MALAAAAVVVAVLLPVALLQDASPPTDQTTPVVSPSTDPIPQTTLGSEPQSVETSPALLDIAQVGHGPFTEGSYSFIEVTGPDGELVAEGVFGPAEPIVIQTPVTESSVIVRAYQRGCPGSCPTKDNLTALDPVRLECETRIDLTAGEAMRVLVDGRNCEISQVDIPETTPRRCLPEETTVELATNKSTDGATVITTHIENVGPALCEVVLDDVRAALTDGAGHLFDLSPIEGNPIFVSARAGALHPGETLEVVFEWRNTCGDYAAVTFQIDITNVGSAQQPIPYPECNPQTDGALEFTGFRLAGQAEGACSTTSINRVDYPHTTALEALAAFLDEMGPGSGLPEISQLPHSAAEDFIPALRTNTQVTFRLIDQDHQLTLRARHSHGGWAVDTITICNT